MTEQQSPITPPNELVRKWLENYFGCWDDVTIAAADVSRYIAAKSIQWSHEQRGAANEAELQKARDQELEACCEYLTKYASWEPEDVQEMRDARRPRTLSLKEQALQALENADGSDHPVVVTVLNADQHALIRRALESLSD